MSYTNFVGNRVMPKFPVIKTHTSYMKVEDVLRYLKIVNKSLPINQYTIGEMTCHFFKCADVAGRIGAREYRIMECEVVQFMVEDTK